MENTKKINLFKKFTLLMILSLILLPYANLFTVNKATTENGASTEATTEATGDSGGIDSIGVTMGEDGSISISGVSDSDSTSTWNRIFNEYKVVIIGISGIATLTFLVFFIINILKLGASGDNPNARKSATIALIVTFIACALCGSVTLFVGLAWNAFK